MKTTKPEVQQRNQCSLMVQVQDRIVKTPNRNLSVKPEVPNFQIQSNAVLGF